MAIYEAPDILPLPVFAKLAGKSRDQINREIKAGNLFSLSMGNRGQRVPDWQLVPVKNKLVQVVLKQAQDADSWRIYNVLIKPHQLLDGRSPVEVVTQGNFQAVAEVAISERTGDVLWGVSHNASR